MINSKAGQRLAKAKDELDRWKAGGDTGGTKGYLIREEYKAAAIALANELIAQGHHAAEDYT